MSKPSPESKKLDRLIRNWERYRELVAPAIAGEDNSDRREKSFLALKAELAAQIQWLSRVRWPTSPTSPPRRWPISCIGT